jgi:hypothetical protein
MPANPPSFTDVQAILFTIADAWNENEREQIYGRHDARARFSWETEAALLAAVANPRGADIRLIDPLDDYGSMPPDEVRKRCTLLQMLTTQPPAQNPRMPVLRPGTNRRYATDAEIDTIVGWLQSLPYPRA